MREAVMTVPTRFGCFLSPLHPVGESPHQLLRRDLDDVVLADRLGFDEFWVGEHHSGGWGLISSPELFLVAAAERTTRITLATGVLTAPYHHPFMVAERASLLTHLTSGRFVLGLGAGSVTGDMHMLGISPADTRRRTADCAETVTALLRGEVVTRTEDWFELHDGRVQMVPFRGRPPEVVVASAATPFGMELCGRLGLNPLSHGSPPWGVIRPGDGLGLERLAGQWEVYAETAAAHGNTADRDRWRVSFPVHVSTSKEEAAAEIKAGWLRQRRLLWKETMGMPMSSAPMGDERAFEATLRQGGVIHGSAEDCIEQIEQLAEQTGGFGCLLVTLQDWASPEAQRRSLTSFAHHVVPHFTGETRGLEASRDWTAGMKDELQRRNSAGRVTASTAAAGRVGPAGTPRRQDEVASV